MYRSGKVVWPFYCCDPGWSVLSMYRKIYSHANSIIRVMMMMMISRGEKGRLAGNPRYTRPPPKMLCAKWRSRRLKKPSRAHVMRTSERFGSKVEQHQQSAADGWGQIGPWRRAPSSQPSRPHRLVGRLVPRPVPPQLHRLLIQR